MIKIKSAHEIELMRIAGRIAAEALHAAGKLVLPGVTTREIAAAAEKVIRRSGATPSFLGYGGFPGVICCSLNDEVIHGIPGGRIVRDGDIVKLDVGALYRGYHGDCAQTFAAGTVSAEARRLIDVTRQSFYEGIRFARAGQRISDISHAIAAYTEENGFSVVRDFVGHGVGNQLHEAPEVPNYGKPGRGARLVPGMTLAIEPMVNMGTHEVKILPDGWTVKTADEMLSSHFERTLLVTSGDPVILTSCEGEGEP